MKLRNNQADYAWRAGKRDRRRLDDAVAGFRAAIALGDQLLADHPQANEYRRTLNGVRANLARLLQQLGRCDEAEVAARSMLTDYDRLSADEPNRSRWIINRMGALDRLAQICARSNPKAAESLWAEAAAAADRLGTQFTSEAAAITAAAWFFANCPNESQRDPAKASAFAGKAIELVPESADAHSVLGLARFRAGDATGAIEALLHARRLFRQRDRATDLILALAYDLAGESTSARREYDAACKKLDATLEHGEDLDQLRAEADRHFRKPQ